MSTYRDTFSVCPNLLGVKVEFMSKSRKSKRAPQKYENREKNKLHINWKEFSTDTAPIERPFMYKLESIKEPQKCFIQPEAQEEVQYTGHRNSTPYSNFTVNLQTHGTILELFVLPL